MTDRNRWLEKIEALLRKAEAKGTTPEESATFTAKAEELMAKWKIEATELRAEQVTVDPTEDVEQIRVYVWKSAMMNAHVQLLCEIAYAHDCKMFYNQARWDPDTNQRRAGRVFTIYGMPEDLAAVQLLYASLQIQAANEYLSPAIVAERQRVCGTGASAGGKAIRFKNSFMSGYAARIGSRLQEIRRHQESQVSSSTALVLVDSKAAVVKRFETDNPNLGRGSALSGGNQGQGFGSGYEAGGRAKLQESVG